MKTFAAITLALLAGAVAFYAMQLPDMFDDDPHWRT
jgi:hypothetical protein